MDILSDRIKKIECKISENLGNCQEILDTINECYSKKENLSKSEQYIRDLLKNKSFKNGVNLLKKYHMYEKLWKFLIIITLLSLSSFLFFGFSVATCWFLEDSIATLLTIIISSLVFVSSFGIGYICQFKSDKYRNLYYDYNNPIINKGDYQKKFNEVVNLKFVNFRLNDIIKKQNDVDNEINNKNEQIMKIRNMNKELHLMLQKLIEAKDLLSEPMNKVIEENMTDELKDNLLNVDNLLEKKVLVKERV